MEPDSFIGIAIKFNKFFITKSLYFTGSFCFVHHMCIKNFKKFSKKDFTFLEKRVIIVHVVSIRMRDSLQKGMKTSEKK